MKQTLLRNVSLYARNCLVSPPTCNLKPSPSLAASTRSFAGRLFSSGNDSSTDDSSSAEISKPSLDSSLTEAKKRVSSIEVQDINNKELKTRMEEYLKDGKEEALPSILEAILQRKLAGKHEETDDELVDDMQMQPLDDVKDKDFESDFEEIHDTDEEMDDLYNAKDVVVKKMVKDEFFEMDDKKWDGIVEEAIKHGIMKDMKECEAVLEDMLSWDKLLPDDIKKKVEEKFNDLGDRCERGELEPEDAYKLFKEFEDEIVMEYMKKVEAQEPPQFDEKAIRDMKRDIDDPPELGLSKHQFRRLRELVGKRYNPGKDELTITSERFEHREENRKDCLRTLLSLIEEAEKANKLAEDARVSYVKERLKANPAFMERLRNKTMRLQGQTTMTA
ncbi:hypothetical protein M0R45_029939 [Rubus argutus]|uniref:Small ribosomal subunit protein mS35 mitochondrial conserved domain-containing protein n=1 Tax=Rubus argutus TaxID=59490 RepID=A0AAW1WBP2_RUBAR